MNFRRIARASNAACKGPRMVSSNTTLLAILLAGDGSRSLKHRDRSAIDQAFPKAERR